MTSRGLVALLLTAAVVAAAGTAFHFATTTHTDAARGPQASTLRAASRLSLPLFFELNQGQTDPRVKFLARGAGYSLFLTTDEAVLELQRLAVSHQPSAPPPSAASVIRMRLDGANSSAHVSGVEPLRGKSNYFIGNDPAKWHRNIPQFARVNYAAVYPGVDLVYYGNQGQLEYDFRVAPGADPGQIALNFDGASARLDSGNLVLFTGQGALLFHAPQIYQQEGNTRKTIAGSFRQLAGNKIGFAVGAYDRSRELVIDPTLSYSTYLGPGGGTVGESAAQVAVDSGLKIYVAGSTTSANFPLPGPPEPPPIQSTLNGVQNIFIAKIDPFATGKDELLFATYLGGEGTDTAAGLAVDGSGSIYVAGYTTSTLFPTTPNAFQQTAAVAGTHGFLSKISPQIGQFVLSYSTYLAGNVANGSSTGDTVTGLAIDGKQDAFVTGTTTSTDLPSQSVGFPANLNGYQQQSNGGTSQFFASKINTAGSGFGSMLYSTYFGGGNPVDARTRGGGIAVDTNGNMYFTGSTNFQGAGTAPFPLLNAQQTCLNEAGKNSNCTNPAPSNVDAFVAKINPNQVGSAGLVFSTFLGGLEDDFGLAVAVDTASNPYVTGETFSTDWNVPTSPAPFQPSNAGGGDAFIAKLGPLASGIYPIAYFTYLGGTGEDVGRAIAVDAVQAAHVTGSTNSADLSVYDELDKQPNGYGGGGDAFVALISTTFSGHPLPPPAPFNGDYLTYLGGSDFDQGTGIAIDSNNATYVAGETSSSDFPTQDPYPPGTLQGTQDAFVSKISALSLFAFEAVPTVSPNPANMGLSATFTFTFVNNGPEAANNVIFSGSLTGTSQGQGFTFTSANTSPGGSCPAPVGGVLTCQIGTVAAASNATVTVVLVPTCSSPSTCASSLTVNPTLSANGGAFLTPPCPLPNCVIPPQVNVDDFTITATQTSQTVVAGNSTSYSFTLAPVPSNQTYTGSVSMSFSGLPQATTGTWTTNPVTISGNTSTTLNIATTARPVNTGRLQQGGPLYAAWLPVAGLSLVGLGLGAGWKRRWVAGAFVGLIAAIILLQPACGSSRSTTPTSSGTPAGTYSLTITATSGTDVHTVPVTLIVQ